MKLIAPILSTSSALLLLGADATADETQGLRGSNRLLAEPVELFRIKHPHTGKYLEPTMCTGSPKIQVSELSANDPMQLWYWTNGKLVSKGCKNKAITLSGCNNGHELVLKDTSSENSPKQKWIAHVVDGKKGRISSGHCKETMYMDKGKNVNIKVWKKGNDAAQNFIIELQPKLQPYSTITGNIYEGKPLQKKDYSYWYLATPWKEGDYSGLKDVTVTCFRKQKFPEEICSITTKSDGSFTCRGKRVSGDKRGIFCTAHLDGYDPYFTGIITNSDKDSVTIDRFLMWNVYPAKSSTQYPEDDSSDGEPCNAGIWKNKAFFRHSCRQHDYCWGEGEENRYTKSDCDFQFRLTMRNQCRMWNIYSDVDKSQWPTDYDELPYLPVGKHMWKNRWAAIKTCYFYAKEWPKRVNEHGTCTTCYGYKEP